MSDLHDNDYWEGVFKRGDIVDKIGGDYTFTGTVVAVFTKLDGGQTRYIVEDHRGLLLIHSAKVLKHHERS